MGRSYKRRVLCSTFILLGGLFWLGASPAPAATLADLLVPGATIVAEGLEFRNFTLVADSTQYDPPYGPSPSEINVSTLPDDPETPDHDPGIRFESAWTGMDSQSWTQFRFDVETNDENAEMKGITLTLTDFDVPLEAVGGVAVQEAVFEDDLFLNLLVYVEAFDTAPTASGEFAPRRILHVEKFAVAEENSGNAQVILRQFEQRFPMTGSPTKGPQSSAVTLADLSVPGATIVAEGLEFGNFTLLGDSTQYDPPYGPSPSEIYVSTLPDDPETPEYDPGIRFDSAWSGKGSQSWTWFRFDVETADANAEMQGITLTLTDFDVQLDAVGGVAVQEAVFTDDLFSELLVFVEAYDSAPTASETFAPRRMVQVEKTAVAEENSGNAQVVLRQFEQRFPMTGFSKTGANPGYVEVPVDIKPRGCKNRLNVRKTGGTVSVGILGREDLDVTQIDPASVMLEGVSPLSWSYRDVNGPGTPVETGTEKLQCQQDCTNGSPDDKMDLILKFKRRDFIKALGTVENGECLVLSLEGSMTEEFGETNIGGEDVVSIVKKNKKKKPKKKKQKSKSKNKKNKKKK